MLGSHVKLMSYQGPYYDGTSLSGAEKLTEQTLQLFPDLEDRQRLKEELGKLYLLKAQRAWAQVEYWNKKDNPRAVAVACLNVIREYPDTRYAEAARRNLAIIDRRLLSDLPEMDRILDSLPKPDPPAGSSGHRVKSVSDSGGPGRVQF
ncbi:MAG: hypothetical protein R3C19_24945 [Planctomycetaceae bacterium]